MNFAQLGVHKKHPLFASVVIEQPCGEAQRIRFNADSGEFYRTDDLSLLHARGFKGAYGWIAGTGVPPGAHHDVMVLTRMSTHPGQVIEAKICGMFRRADGDNKFVAISSDLSNEDLPDLFSLSNDLQREVFAVYPNVGEGEAWVGGELARAYLRDVPATHD